MATKESKFKKLRSVTLPVLKVEKNTERGFYFHGPMYLGEKVDPKKDPATLIHAVDVETGEEGLLIVPAVMQGELVRHYGAAGYVGKCFGVTLTRVPEKNYNIVSLDEIGEPDDFSKPSTPPNAGSKEPVEFKGRKFANAVEAAAALAGKRRDDGDEDPETVTGDTGRAPPANARARK